MPDTPASRQRQIVDLLQSHRSLTVQELVAELGVSPMTIHRDLNRLADTNQIVKLRGSVTLPAPPVRNASTPMLCAVCNRVVPERTAFIVQSQQQGLLGACCPHCGLALLDRCAAEDQVLVTDFLVGQMVSASDAAYLLGSDVSTCCRPGILAFASHADAERFQRGFGGEIMTLAQAQNYLRSKLQVLVVLSQNSVNRDIVQLPHSRILGESGNVACTMTFDGAPGQVPHELFRGRRWLRSKTLRCP